MCIRDRTRGPRQNSASRRWSEEFNDAETEKVIPKRINKLESPDDGNNQFKWVQKNAGELEHLFNIINNPEVYHQKLVSISKFTEH